MIYDQVQNVTHAFDCQVQPDYTYVLEIILCVGGIVSYFPQYYYLIKTKDSKGISESSLFLLNLGSFFVFANCLILNWWKFQCFGVCSNALCVGNLGPVLQIGIGCLVPFPLYLLFVKYRIEDEMRNKRKLYILMYIGIYIIFVMLMVIVGLVEKLENPNSWAFFYICAKLFGIATSICFSVVWIPQIYTLLKTKEQGNLSLAMFLMQTPGNALIIMFQILYHQDWSTWIAYVITLVEQFIIVVILLVYRCQNRRNIELI